MSRSKMLNHYRMLIDEINHLKTLLKPEDTGHIHTTISVLEERVEEIQSSFNLGIYYCSHSTIWI